MSDRGEAADPGACLGCDRCLAICQAHPPTGGVVNLPQLLAARRAQGRWTELQVRLRRSARLFGLQAPGGLPYWPPAPAVLPSATLGEGVEKVVLFASCLGRALPEEVGLLARGLANRGLAVEVMGRGCCGREAYAEGAVDLADRESLDTLLRLVERVKQGATVLTLEQGCLSFLQGYRDRLAGIEADLLSAHTHSLLGYLLRPGGPPLAGEDTPVTLHVDCRFPPRLVEAAVRRLGDRMTVSTGCAGGHRLVATAQSALALGDLADRALLWRPPVLSTCPLAAWRLRRLGIPVGFLGSYLLAAPGRS